MVETFSRHSSAKDRKGFNPCFVKLENILDNLKVTVKLSMLSRKSMQRDISKSALASFNSYNHVRPDLMNYSFRSAFADTFAAFTKIVLVTCFNFLGKQWH